MGIVFSRLVPSDNMTPEERSTPRLHRRIEPFEGCRTLCNGQERSHQCVLSPNPRVAPPHYPLPLRLLRLPRFWLRLLARAAPLPRRMPVRRTEPVRMRTAPRIYAATRHDTLSARPTWGSRVGPADGCGRASIGRGKSRTGREVVVWGPLGSCSRDARRSIDSAEGIAAGRAWSGGRGSY